MDTRFETGPLEKLRYQIALEVSATGTFCWDIENNLVYWDDNLCKIYGVEPGHFPRTLAEFLERVYPEDKARVAFAVQEALRTGKDMNHVLRVVHPDGSIIWLNDRASIYTSEDGKRFMFGACNDITAIKTVESELVRAKNNAEQANRAKNLFLANISHELRTPLAAIIGFAEILAEDLDDERAKHYLNIILRNGRHLTSIVGDMVDFASIEAGSVSIHTTEVDVKALLAELRTLYLPKAEGAGLRFSITCETPGPTIIYLDAKRFRQIISNLIDNALKFTKAGGVEATVRLAPCNKDPSVCELDVLVSDTGIGMTEETAKRIFKPFVRAEDSYSVECSGTGLGLALSRSLARAMGGDLFLVHSSPGQGSTFRAQVSGFFSCKDTGQPLERERPNGLPNIQGKFNGRNILIVDDNLDNQTLICELLRPTGANLVLANCGEDAIRRIKRINFDLAILDLRMPGLDGYATFSLMRQEGYCKPVLALTAQAGPFERKRALEAGFEEFITKPIDRQSLFRILERQTL